MNGATLVSEQESGLVGVEAHAVDGVVDLSVSVCVSVRACVCVRVRVSVCVCV